MTASELRAIRRALRLTQEQFAERLGRSTDSVKSMELGRRPITASTEKLATLILDAETPH